MLKEIAKSLAQRRLIYSGGPVYIYVCTWLCYWYKRLIKISCSLRRRYISNFYLVAMPNTCCLERVKWSGCETYPSKAKNVHETFLKPAFSISATQSTSKRQLPNKAGHMPVRVNAICNHRMKVPSFSGTCSTKIYFPP